MGFEQDLAQRVLDEQWSDHPDTITADSLWDVAKQTILLVSGQQIPEQQRVAMSVADCYRMSIYNGPDVFIGERKLTYAMQADEIEQQTKLGTSLLYASYDIARRLLQVIYKNKP